MCACICVGKDSIPYKCFIIIIMRSVFPFHSIIFLLLLLCYYFDFFMCVVHWVHTSRFLLKLKAETNDYIFEILIWLLVGNFYILFFVYTSACKKKKKIQETALILRFINGSHSYIYTTNSDYFIFMYCNNNNKTVLYIFIFAFIFIPISI